MKRATKRDLGRLKEIRVDWEMFNFVVWCVIGPYADLKKYILFRHRALFDQEEPGAIAGYYFDSVPRVGGILWLPVVPRTPAQIGYLAHEVTHAVMDLTRHASFGLNSKTEETICYAIAHGVEQILKGVRNARRD